MDAIAEPLTYTINDSDQTLSFDCEWQRIECLGQCLEKNRKGETIDDEKFLQLKDLQQTVQEFRLQASQWQVYALHQLSLLEQDILICCIAVEMEPRLGRMFQHLQAGTPQPYPTPALLQELLALGSDEVTELYGALAPDNALRRHRFIVADSDDPYQALKPGPQLSHLFLGRHANLAPPGANRVRTSASWDELILPVERQQMLKEFLLWVQHKDMVVNEWGAKAIGGPVALFAGPSGTGKTFAASVLATELDYPLYRVDLGKLVSKYIGETEKNLNALFEAAHGQKMILQFDEADSLFAKRGEVKEARDRYANMEVSHLLARIEEHDGPCILTSNLRNNIDSAFARRFQMVITFPRPDVQSRIRLWQQLLPPRAPKDENVDVNLLGKTVNMTGGNIRNAALHAAFLAAGDNKPISLKHIAIAIWREMSKDGREVNRLDLGSLAKFLPDKI